MQKRTIYIIQTRTTSRPPMPHQSLQSADRWPLNDQCRWWAISSAVIRKSARSRIECTTTVRQCLFRPRERQKQESIRLTFTSDFTLGAAQTENDHTDNYKFPPADEILITAVTIFHGIHGILARHRTTVCNTN